MLSRKQIENFFLYEAFLNAEFAQAEMIEQFVSLVLYNYFDEYGVELEFDPEFCLNHYNEFDPKDYDREMTQFLKDQFNIVMLNIEYEGFCDCEEIYGEDEEDGELDG